MADGVDGVEAKVVDPAGDDAVLTKTQTKTSPAKDPVATQTTQKASCKKHSDSKDKKADVKKSKKRPKKVVSSDAESSDSDDSSSSSSTSEEEADSDDESSSSEDSEQAKRKAKKAKAKAKKIKAKKAKKQSKSKKKAVQEDDSSEDDASDMDKVQAAKDAAMLKALQRRTQEVDSDGLEMDNSRGDPHDAMKELMARLRLQPRGGGRGRGRGIRGRGGWPGSQLGIDLDLDHNARILTEAKKLAQAKAKDKDKDKKKRASKIAFKRVDQLWDQSIHNYKLTETVDDPDQDEWEQYIFTVRRKFDWEHKYQETFVDIKSKPLKDCLQHVMKDVKSVSLVQDTPHVDPNMLFLYLEECRAYMDELKESAKAEKKKKARNAQKTRAKHLKILIKYLDKDYADTKKTLYPMLENNTITFDLLWALYKPNTIAYCSTYGDSDQPRAFKIDFATKESHFMKGTWYSIEGKYLEYDGKAFGMGAMHTDVPSFQGARKISSLDCFPLQYHRETDKLRAKLIERGKKFVALKGMNYRCHTGMAYTKRKRQILKININGRVMVDPAIHRRINPNYPISTVRPKEEGDYPDLEDTESSCGCDDSSDEDAGGDGNTPSSSEENHKERKKFKVVRDDNGRHQLVEIESGDEGEDGVKKEKLTGRKDEIEETFSDEELLIASPVVLGFAFSEKLWLEFTVSGISDIVWNEGAFDSLVLPENQKSIVKALVSSHAFHPSRSIDDIISGKGKGLVAVLHGPPGTGKTLTAEGIADLLKCPLYMVSAGDLGTDPRNLEKELQNILDIAHSWGALLLLDEADVFLEKRSIHDIHRNALVSIFLRLLEYFQGILFLTTNRVETFDEAFVSRIHLSLRYSELTVKARKTVWKMFIQRVRDSEDMKVEEITDDDLSTLAKRNINGRQIKNLTRAAQALAVHEGKPMGMSHIKRVLDVAESFITDLKGGEGYIEAMRGYT